MPYTILVTGANRGIGYEAVKLLSQEKPDATILLGSRTAQNGQAAIEKMKTSSPSSDFSNIKVVELDITSSSSLSSAVAHVKSTYSTLDVLINNSGIAELDGDGLSPAIFDVNVRGAKNTIEAFTPILTPQSGIVVFVSSQVGGWYTKAVGPKIQAELLDAQSTTWEKVEGWMADWRKMADGGKANGDWVPLDQGMTGSMYFVSKALINPWVRKYAVDHSDVRVAIVCPGYCSTGMTKFAAPREASMGGASIAWPVLNEFESGKFYQDGKQLGFDTGVPK
jgi:NAD(P)-dependent dehydrogenase (short-subunit alcohol dehydrogenase family)